MKPDDEAAEPKGIISIAVEDECILMLHRVVHWDGNMWQIQNTSNIQYLERNIDAPDGDETDWRENNPLLVVEEVCAFINKCLSKPETKNINIIGISIFGNVDIHSGTIRYKFDRKGINNDEYFIQLREQIERRCRIQEPYEVLVRNDATSAAYGEILNAENTPAEKAFVYIWLGRGVNGGIILFNQSHLGFMHPEMGHTFPRFHPMDEASGFVEFLRTGKNPRCVSHRDCLLALTARRSIKERLSAPYHMSKSDATKIVAFYLAQLCANLVVTICPARIVVGGSTIRRGLLDGDELLEEVKDAFKKLMQGFPSYTMSNDLDQLLGLSQLGDLSSLEGIWMSSLEAVEERRQSVERILSGALGNETRDRYLARRAQHREPIDARL